METLGDLANGFGTAIQPSYLVFALVGAIIGTIIGALPGIGPSATLAILLPVVFGMDPTAAMIMFAGIYTGAMYGGTLTAVLINVPGESSSVMTAVEGYKMALRGLAGKAIAIASIGSFVAGTISFVLLALVAAPLAEFALGFGPPEYFLLILLGLMSLTLLGSTSFAKTLLVAAIGLLLGTVGIDPMRGVARFTFGLPFFVEGVAFIAVAIGMFGIGEVLSAAQARIPRQIEQPTLRNLFPSIREVWAMRGPMLRGSGIGFVLGILPGAGANLASFMSYAIERRLSRHPERFGREGAIEGVAGPESANNASTGGALVPMLSLGIPGSGVTAVMLAAMILLGLRPGPLLFQDNPEFAWTLIASLYISNFMLLVLNLPLVPVFAMVLRLPYAYLYPVILGFVMVGAFSINNNVFGVWLVLVFGALGYAFQRLELPAAPLVLALVLGPLFERSLVQSLTISRGDPTIFLSRPVTAALLVMIVAVVVVPRVWRFGRILRMRMRGPPESATTRPE